MTPDQQHVDEARRIPELQRLKIENAWLIEERDRLMELAGDQQERITAWQKRCEEAEASLSELAAANEAKRERITLLEAENEVMRNWFDSELGEGGANSVIDDGKPREVGEGE